MICWASVGVRNKYLTPLTGFFVNLDNKRVKEHVLIPTMVMVLWDAFEGGHGTF